MNTQRDQQAGADLKAAARRKGSFLQTMKAVAWSFLGIRRSSDHAKDVAELNPVHVVIAGVLGAALFVLALVLLVRWVIASGAAA
ncbi:MAG: DUF2970 domain-containing protein [Aquabacterium sp.]|jgi:hypothetical protein|nr:MAG: DUF2970 domain-containing protein [Aquabacterium sp.]